MRRIPASWFLPLLVAAITVITTASRGDVVGFEISPQFVSLGQFSAGDPTDNILNPGSTLARVRCDNPWAVYVTLLEPIRRITDGTELPLERARQMYPDVIDAFSQYMPVRFDIGPGTADEWQEFNLDWQALQMRIEQFLDEADPPGIYQSSVSFALTDREGNPLVDPITVTVEFEVLPWVEIEVLDEQFHILVTDPGGEVESDPLFVHIRANCAWALAMACLGDLIDQQSGRSILMTALQWSVDEGDAWVSLIPSFMLVSEGLIAAATGEDPPPFSLAEAYVPVRLQIMTEMSTGVGSYTTDVDFRAIVEIAGR